MAYQSDLSEEQFEYIKEYLPKKKKTSTRKYTYLELFNAILYVLVVSGECYQMTCQSGKQYIITLLLGAN